MRYFSNRIFNSALLVMAIVGLLSGVSVAQTVKTVIVRATVVDNAGKAKDGVQLELYKNGATTGDLISSRNGGYANFTGVSISKSDIYELKVGGSSAKDWQAVYITLSPENITKTCPSCLFSVPGTVYGANKTGDRYVKVGLGIATDSGGGSLIVGGYVKDADGKTGVIKNAKVVGTGGKEFTTGSDGKYTLSFDNLKSGNAVTLTAVASGYSDKTESIIIGSDTTVNRDILMQKSAVAPPPPPAIIKPTIELDKNDLGTIVIEPGKKAPSQEFQVWSGGEVQMWQGEIRPESILNFTVSSSSDPTDVEGVPFLNLSRLSGQSKNKDEKVGIRVDFFGSYKLPARDAPYLATLTISDPNASNSPRTVTVSIKVNKPAIEMGDVWHSLVYGNVFDAPKSATNYCNRTKGTAPMEVRPKTVSPYGISIVGIMGNIAINPEFYDTWQCLALPDGGKYKSAYQIKYKTNAVPSVISMLADKLKNAVPVADEDMGSVEVTPSAAPGKDGKPSVADVRFYAFGGLFHKQNIDPKVQPIPIDYVRMRINIYDKITDMTTAVGKVPTKTRGGGLLGDLAKIGAVIIKKNGAEKLGEVIADALGKDKDAALKPTYADGYLVLTRNKAIRDKYLSSATISQAEFEALKGEINTAEDLIPYTSKAPIDTWLWAKEPTYPFFVFANLAPNTVDRHIVSKLQEVKIISSERSAGVPPQTSVVRKIEPKIDANSNLVSIEEYLPKPYAEGEQVSPRIVDWIPNTGKQFTEEAK